MLSLLDAHNSLSPPLVVYGISHSRVIPVEKDHYPLVSNGFSDIILDLSHLDHSSLLFASSLELFSNTIERRFKLLTKITPL